MSCKNYEDELRRIKEKYGDLLDDTEEKTVILTGEQCLALLPADAPISHSIFEAGFYFNGRGVKEALINPPRIQSMAQQSPCLCKKVL